MKIIIHYLWLCVLISIGGCVFPPFYEPYPAMQYVEIGIKDTPQLILDTFETTYPLASIIKIEEEYFKKYLRGYIIHYTINDSADIVFITRDGEIVVNTSP